MKEVQGIKGPYSPRDCGNCWHRLSGPAKTSP